MSISKEGPLAPTHASTDLGGPDTHINLQPQSSLQEDDIFALLMLYAQMLMHNVPLLMQFVRRLLLLRPCIADARSPHTLLMLHVHALLMLNVDG
jgi:hypothetical protein